MHISFRSALLRTTILVFPIAVEAQNSQGPITGVSLGAAGGFNIKTNPNINGIETNIPGAAGRETPNANLSRGNGGGAVGPIGYGLRNGLRVEIEGDYRGNSFSNTSGNNRAGNGISTGASG